MKADKIFNEFLGHLCLARKYFSSQKGQYKDREADDYLIQSWAGYCADIGISYQTANSWINTAIADRRLPMPTGFAAAVWWLTEGKKAAEDFPEESRKRAGRIISAGFADKGGRAG